MAFYFTKSEILYFFVVVGLIFLIFFLQIKPVGGSSSGRRRPTINDCGSNGMLNVTSNLCACYNGFYGPYCDHRYCPFGQSWIPKLNGDHERRMPNVECSNMGICDSNSGMCLCRDGYEGRACERLACAKYGDMSETPSLQPSAVPRMQILPGNGWSNEVPSKVKQCSGHGLCLTMREASTKYDGVSLLRPPVEYTGWDADMIQGCVCDSGWRGHDCSQRTCPFGKDPLAELNGNDDDGDGYYSMEKYILQCQANAGYFSLWVMGKYSQAIPFDADPGYVKFALESISGIGEVTVTMPANSQGLPTACWSDSIASTEIEFTNFAGSRPPMSVSMHTASTRVWRDGDTPLTLSSSTPILRMATKYTITCPICATCQGSVHFIYRDSVSAPVDITASNADTLITAAITSLTDLTNEEWPSFSISSTFSNANKKICISSGVSTTTIYIYSTYGNVPGLNILDASQISSVSSTSHNLIWTSNLGKGTLYECSNQGYCNRASGECKCFQAYVNSELVYRAKSSDGEGSAGSRRDCGYIDVAPSSCLINGVDLCSGHGVCSNTTMTCSCFGGWYGIHCGLKDCPQGAAWFDEAISSVEAHQPAECSNMGACDRSTGSCYCRDGFTGAACDIMDCPRDPDSGAPCSGHGWCMSLADIAEMRGHVYGPPAATNPRNYPLEWDAKKIYQCVCSAQSSAPFDYNLRRPALEPNAVISGITSTSQQLPGWSGYDCSQRNCPVGDVVNNRVRDQAYVEIQRVICNGNSASSFYFSIRGHLTAEITGGMRWDQIEQAISYAPTVGNVSIRFINVGYDHIQTACSVSVNGTKGGFLVRFDTEMGNLPLMVPTGTSANLVEVLEYRRGNTTQLECSGPSAGVCDRETGMCMCAPSYGSSDGSGGPGTRGDCGWRATNGIFDRAEAEFGEQLEYFVSTEQ